MVLAVAQAKAQNTFVVPNIDFESGSAQYDNATSQTTGFFRDTSSTTAGELNITTGGAGNHVLRAANTNNANALATTVYDTTPADSSSATDNTFLNSTIRVDFTANSATQGLGIFARENNGGTSGYLALANFDKSGAFDQLRIFNGFNTVTSGVGTVLADSGATTDKLTLGTFYTLELTTTTVSSNVQLDAKIFAQGATTNPLFALSFTDSSGGALTSAGTIGLRLAYPASATGLQPTDADNFNVVPEPLTWTMMLGGLGLLAGLQRLRKRTAPTR